MKEKNQKYWAEKTVWNKSSDLFFLIFVIAMLFPQGRMAIGGFVNQVKAKMTTPSVISEDEITKVDDLNWSLKTIDGQTVNLADYKGKVLFINIWATCCPPCVGEMLKKCRRFSRNYVETRHALSLLPRENTLSLQILHTRRRNSRRIDLCDFQINKIKALWALTNQIYFI